MCTCDHIEGGGFPENNLLASIDGGPHVRQGKPYANPHLFSLLEVSTSAISFAPLDKDLHCFHSQEALSTQ